MCLALVVVSWTLRVTGIINNWTLTVVVLVAMVAAPVGAYAFDFRHRDAPGAFGLPDRRPMTENPPTAPSRNVDLVTDFLEPATPNAGNLRNGS